MVGIESRDGTDYIDRIFNEDCNKGLDRIPDGSIDLIMMDPPYELDTCGGGAFGSFNRMYHGELTSISKGITDGTLENIVSKMKKVNIYIWCNKNQIRQYLNYFADIKEGGGVSMDILTWHKTNPTPTCNNKYLSDTEYCLFFREKGVKLYGSYETKRKWYVSPLNTQDKKLYPHPTIKPLEIVKNLIGNSVQIREDYTPIVMDPFMGSGTTAVASKELGLHYTGFEIDTNYYDIAMRRIGGSIPITSLDAWTGGGASP